MACGNGKGRTEQNSQSCGVLGGGRPLDLQQGEGPPGPGLEAGAQGPSPGGFQECAQRREWAVGNATLLGPKPVEAARPDGPPRRGHGAHEAGQGKPGSPFLHPSPPARNFFVYKSPAFLLPHRTRGLRTNPLGYGHLPKETPGWTHCVSLDLAPVCSPRPQVTPWAAAGAAFPEAGAWAGHAAWVLGVGGETLRLQRRGARTRGAAHGRVPGPHPAPRRVYSAPGPAPCPAPFPPTALARPAP